MNRSTKLIWGTTTLVVATIVLLMVRFARGTERARMELTAIERKLSLVGAELAEAKKAQPAASPLALVDPHAPNSEASTPGATATEGELLQERDNRRRSMLRAWSAYAYEPFFRAAALNPTQIEAFQKAVVDHWLRWSDIVDASREQGIGAGDQSTLKDLAKTEWAQFKSEELDAIGPTGYQQLQQFDRTAPMKSVAETVAGVVFDTSEPLTVSQSAALVDVLANNSAHFQKGGQASLDDLDLSAAKAQLQGVLTAGQLAALETSLAARDASRKLNLSVANATSTNPH